MVEQNSIRVGRKKSDKKKEQILRAAGELFREQGFGVSMDMIASKAEVSKQTVYSHFSSKGELFETCIIHQCEKFQEKLSLEPGSQSPEHSLTAFCFSFQNMLLNQNAIDMYQTIISQRDAHPDIANAFIETGPKHKIRLVSEFLSELNAAGMIKLEQPVEDAAMQLLMMAMGKPVYWAQLGADAGETDEKRYSYIQNCVRLFLRGCCWKG